MSLSEIEEEARRIIEKAEEEARRIIEEARAEAQMWRKKEIKNPLTDEEVSEVVNEFKRRYEALVRDYELKERGMKERYARVKDDIVNEVVRIVAGV